MVPPLGIIGVASPLTAAGYLFPGTRWAGLAATAFLPGIVLSTQVLNGRRRGIILGLILGFCIGFTIEARAQHPQPPEPPRGWAAVDTHLGDVSAPFRDIEAAQFIQDKAADSLASVLIFPEAVVPRWSDATAVFWRQSLDRCRARGQILLLGAGLSSETTVNQDTRSRLSDLRSYDFGSAVDVLRGAETLRPLTANLRSTKPHREALDNTLLILGAESGAFFQRVPVPMGMWRPFSRLSVPLRLTGPGVVMIAHQRAAVLICYEQMLSFPILVSMLQHPTVIVGISNTFWVSGTPIARYQATALRSWAKLFRLPYLLAANS